MKHGDLMILNSENEVGQAEVVVLNSLGEYHVWVRCACGSEVTVPREHLRPAPRVRLDMSGRIALHVVEEETK